MTASIAAIAAVPRPEPDRAEAEKFLRSLCGSADSPIAFQTFDDDKGRGRKGLARILLGTLAQHWSELVRLNMDGAGIYVMINEGDGQGRAEKNVKALRALFVDDDSGELTPQALELTPTIVSRSKNG